MGVSRPVQRVWRWRRGHQGHSDGHTPRDGPEDEPKVEVVYLAHNVMPPLRRLGGVVIPAGGHRGGELQPEPDEADHQANHQAPEGPRLVCPESAIGYKELF